jgi:hypothetical protein
MALLDQAQEAQVVLFQQRVQAAMCQAAVSVQGESPAVLLSADVAAAGTTITPLSVTGFATGDLVLIGSGASADTRKITVSGANFTVTALTNAHKAGEVIQKLIWNSVNRRTLAKAALNNPTTYAILFAAAICGNDPSLTIQNDGSITDASIQNGVAACWNAVAGTT